MGQRLKHETETVKLLEENIGKKLPDISLDSNFFEYDHKSTGSFCASKFCAYKILCVICVILFQEVLTI